MKFLIPLIALLFAGPALADPISAFAAIGTAVGAGAAAAVTTGIMVVGTAISVVGTITGNKKLARFGGLVSLAGGVGALYQTMSQAATGVATNAAASTAAAEGATATASGVSSGQAVARGLGEAVPGLVDAGAAAAPAVAEAAAPAAQQLTGIDAAMADAGAGATSATSAASPVSDALAQASKHVGTFIKENKELVKLGGDLIGGAMRSQAAANQLEDAAAIERQKRADYNAGIQSGSSIPFTVNPNVTVTQVPVQDPQRYIPQRGLINQTQGK